jgi:DNA invertase Pin-like site-specific DNA recombinase
MDGKKIGYIRVSGSDQNPDRQLESMELHERFVDYCSATTRDRPQLNAMIRYARKGDTVYIHDLDRLARKLKDLKEIVDELVSQDVTVQFVSEGLTFNSESSYIAQMQLHMLGTFAEFEFSHIEKRRKEGIARAKAAGKYKGRQKMVTPETVEMIKAKLEWGIHKEVIAKQLGISLSTIYNYLKPFNKKIKYEEPSKGK